MIKDKILVIDDEAGIRSSLKGILEDEGYSIKTARNGEDALHFIKSNNFDLILLDIWLPEMDGIEVLKEIKKMDANAQVVMISGHGSIETAVQAIKLGAYDFLEKPLSLEKVILAVKNALKHRKLEEENIQLREKLGVKVQLTGTSPAIKKLKEDIGKAAPTNSSVLIQGEEGTGKELIARLIHLASSRKDKRFIQLNFAAIPDELIEAELFGYVGANITNAEKDKKGKLLLAERGTLFLDEIGDMSLRIQDKLLQVINEKKFEPLGSNNSFPVNIRIISSTNKNIRERINQGKFSQDLFLKLNVIPMFIPPLRERREDIPLLIDYFLEYFSIQDGKKKKTMNEEAMEAFLNYTWPRNINEMINVIERFVIMVPDEEIKASHLSLLVEPREFPSLPGVERNQPLKQARQQFEKEYIHKALIKNRWDIFKTSSTLKISASQLKKKIKDLNITFFG